MLSTNGFHSFEVTFRCRECTCSRPDHGFGHNFKQTSAVTGQGRRRLTAYHGIWSKIQKLVLELLTEPFYVLLLGFFRVFKALCVGWRYFMKVLVLENFIIWIATRGVSRQRQGSNGIAVVGKVPRNEILASGLLLFIPVLK